MSSDQRQQIPPQNLEAEMAVLGSIFCDRNMLDEIGDLIRPEDFYSAIHERLFASMLALAKAEQPIDAITMAEKAHDLPPERRGEEFAYYAKLMDIVPSAESVKHYARIVREKSDLRAIIAAAAEMTKIAYQGEEDPERAFTSADNHWKAACDRKGRSKGPIDLSAALRRNYDRISDIVDGVAVNNVQKTPWAEFNSYVGGFSPGNMIVWAAAAKAGKSGAVLTLADYASAHYGAVMYVSLEVPTDEMVMRYISLYSTVSVKRQLEGNLRSDELLRVADAQGTISNRTMRFYGKEQCRSLADIRAEMRDLRRKEYVAAVVIDGLNFIREADPSGPRDRSTKNDRMDALYRDILNFASENKVVVHVVTHINRESQKGSGHPKASDIRDGGNPEGHAHAVIMPYRPNAISNIEAEREEGDFVIAAIRIGSAGVVPMSFKLGRGLWLDKNQLRPWFETQGVENDKKDDLVEALGW